MYRLLAAGVLSIFIVSPALAQNQGTPTLNSVTLKGSTSGNVQLTAPAAAGTGTVITLPNVSGTMALNAAYSIKSASSYTIASTDIGKIIEMTNTSANTISIPAATTTGFTAGFSVEVISTANSTTITPASGTICGLSSFTVVKGQYIGISSDGSNYNCAVGSNPSSTVETDYTAAGALALTDDYSVVTSASTVAMTLANDTVDKHQHKIYQNGAGTVNVTANIDGTSQTISLASQGSLHSTLLLRWLASQSTYEVE